jgi:hypothetical protein
MNMRQRKQQYFRKMYIPSVCFAEQNVARVVTQARAPRVVNLNAMRIAERPTEQERRQRACRGHIAEMTERQAGL